MNSMGMFPSWMVSSSPFYQKQSEAVLEEQRKIQERAGHYDQILNLVGFHQFLTTMQTVINSEIANARKCPMEPEKQRLHVIRWDAMQELLDTAQADINESRKERDRIREEEIQFLKATQIVQNMGEEVDA